MFEFKFPDVGEGIHEGVIVKWRVKEGDSVKEDETVCDMETAKAIVELPSPRSGVILKINGTEGDTVKVGDTLVVIGEKGESIEEHGKGVGVVGELPEAPAETGEASKADMILPMASGSKTIMENNINVLPYVRKIADELGVDISKLKGTGPGGRITETDVRKMASPKLEKKESAGIKKTRKYDTWGYVDHVPFKGMRKTIAEHMVMSKFTAPHVTHFDQCDVTSLVKHREKEKKALEKQGIKLTYLPFIIKATIKGLQEFPMLNAELDEAGSEIILKKYFNIGVAVDTEDGLMVPVIKGADQKSIVELAKEIQMLAEKCRKRTVDLADLQGGTFSITSVGSLGGTMFTPIIHVQQSAILAVAAIREMPWAVKGKMAIRQILNIGVTFDHRMVDGAMAARFLNTVMQHLSDPDLLLMEAKT